MTKFQCPACGKLLGSKHAPPPAARFTCTGCGGVSTVAEGRAAYTQGIDRERPPAIPTAATAGIRSDPDRDVLPELATSALSIRPEPKRSKIRYRLVFAGLAAFIAGAIVYIEVQQKLEYMMSSADEVDFALIATQQQFLKALERSENNLLPRTPLSLSEAWADHEVCRRRYLAFHDKSLREAGKAFEGPLTEIAMIALKTKRSLAMEGFPTSIKELLKDGSGIALKFSWANGKMPFKLLCDAYSLHREEGRDHDEAIAKTGRYFAELVDQDELKSR